MHVETFLDEDMEESIAQPDEWKDKIEELGLEGQEKLMGENKSPIPFLALNKRMVKVLENALPQKDEISEYSQSPIPMKLLSMVGLAVHEKYFTRIEVWHSQSDPDPAIVGRTTPLERTEDRNETVYLLGLWGPEKVSLEELEKKAIEKLKKHYLLTIKEARANLETAAENLDAVVDKVLDGQHVYFSVNI